MLRANQERTTAFGNLPGTPMIFIVGYLFWSIRRTRTGV